MGDPTALYVLAFAVVVLGGMAMWVLVASATFQSKMIAMAALTIAAALVFAIFNVPDYTKYKMWIDWATIATVVPAAVASFMLIRRAKE